MEETCVYVCTPVSMCTLIYLSVAEAALSLDVCDDVQSTEIDL